MTVPHLFGNESGFIKRDFLDDNFAALAGSFANVQGYPYFAKGDGVTDDTAAISAAVQSGHRAYFPRPVSFYRITSAIGVPDGTYIEGEDHKTIIRNTAGGDVFSFTGGNEYATIKHLRIGGLNTSAGVSVQGVAYANYLSTFRMDDVHFEADMRIGVDGNCIQNDYQDCTFGYFQNVGINPNLRHINWQFDGGANNTNFNYALNCKFFNGGTTQVAVKVNAALLLTLQNCAWENNGRDLQCDNVQDLLILQGYSERGKHAVSQIEIGASRTVSVIKGFQGNGSSMPAGASFVRAPSASPLDMKECDIGTSAAAFSYQDSTTLSHFPTALHDILTDNRWQGNGTDPVVPFDNVIGGVPVSFVPVANAFTIVNGTGGVGFTGSWSLLRRTLTVNIAATPTGTATIASVAGASYFNSVNANFSPPISGAFCPAIDSGAATTANGFMYVNGRNYGGAFAATNSSVYWSGTTKI